MRASIAQAATGTASPAEVTAAAMLLTTTEAAGRLRLSPRTLERLRVSGEGPQFFKVGPGKRARVLYRPQDLAVWLEQFSYQSTSEYGRKAGESADSG